MTLPVSGPISLADVNTELGLSSTAQIDMNSSAVRTLFAVPSGAISMSNGYGKANQFAFTISSNQTNANLATLATTAGWNGTSKVVATIGSGVYISSNSTGTPALTISGSFPNGVELVNNGYIVGRGGVGGNGTGVDSNRNAIAGSAGSSGGLALSTSVTTTITNNGTIGGGGGGGGGGRASYRTDVIASTYGGGGGGGGRSSAAANSSGGSGGVAQWYASYPGSSGGTGTVSSAGGGGAGGSYLTQSGGSGGAGGGWGSAGSTGNSGNLASQYAFHVGSAYSGGSGGGAVTGNSNITWAATGTRLGSIS